MLDEKEAQPDPSAGTESTAEGAATQAETAGSEPADGEAAAPNTGAEKPAGKPGAEDRINELTREKYGWKARAEKAERELEEARKGKTAEQPKAAAPSDKPRVDNYASYDEYIEALADWKEDQKTKERDEKEKKDREDKAATSRQENFEKQSREAAKKYSDWQQVAMAEHVPYSPTSAKLVMESELAGDLAYHLGMNPDVAERLAKLGDSDPTACAREIGKLEAKLAADPPAQSATKAPAPVKPVGGREPVRRGLGDLSVDEYIARRNKDELKVRTG